MSDDELKEWFWKMFNSCYYVTHKYKPRSLYMYYDLNFIRKAKFRILQGKEIVYPKKPIGICLFEQFYDNELFRCNNDHIWSFIESNSNYNNKEISDLIKGWLEDYTKPKALIPSNNHCILHQKFEVDTKIKFLTPSFHFCLP